MMDNTTYNLMKQLVQEHKSLWRLQQDYELDAKGNPDVEVLWSELAAQKEATIQKLTAELKKHL